MTREMDLAGADGVPPTPATSWVRQRARGTLVAGQDPPPEAPLGRRTSSVRPPGAARRPRQREVEPDAGSRPVTTAFRPPRRRAAGRPAADRGRAATTPRR